MTEPIWNQIADALVLALKGISKSAGYWYDVRQVYEEPQDKYEDKTRLPAIEVFPTPGTGQRQNAGGSQTINAVMQFTIRGILRNDSADRVGPRKQQYRLLQDIHKALLTTDRKLGLARVRGIRFAGEPSLDSGALTGETDRIVLEYQLLVEYSFEENLP